MITLDFTSDSCAILATCDAETARQIGSLGGSNFEIYDDEDFAYCMIGESWYDCEAEGMTEDEIDTYHGAIRAEIEDEIEMDGFDWTEG